MRRAGRGIVHKTSEQTDRAAFVASGGFAADRNNAALQTPKPTAANVGDAATDNNIDTNQHVKYNPNQGE